MFVEKALNDVNVVTFIWNGRVEPSGAKAPDVPPLQSVRAVFPHTAFLRFSPQAFTS